MVRVVVGETYEGEFSTGKMHGAGIFVRADGAHTKARGRTICKKMRYRESDLIKLDILINGDSVEPLAMIVHRDKVATFRGKRSYLRNRLKERKG
ncbi:hypothetical protein HN51_045869 [Arachis hypogaea]|uniref:uncharacterized protein LOC107611752 n=1 Tax=Arachis ipaensis TaxID=130454 RepID=UPI000A2B5D35|nr:uncharacterized protein LOC107611752 [Arachis ipaensis]XP_025672715.1 uncharacterized protein LOC112772044 [Arachis hypogaea]